MIIHPTISDLAGLDLQCSCGRRHQIPIRHIITGEGALDRLPEAAAEFAGKHALVVGDSHTWPLAGDRALELLESAGVNVTKYVFARREHYVTDEYAARTNPRYTILTYLDERGCLDTYARQVTGMLYCRL